MSAAESYGDWYGDDERSNRPRSCTACYGHGYKRAVVVGEDDAFDPRELPVRCETCKGLGWVRPR